MFIPQPAQNGLRFYVENLSKKLQVALFGDVSRCLQPEIQEEMDII